MSSMDLKWDDAGLVTVVAQDRHTGEIRMLAHADRDALDRTLETGEAHFFSRSRGALWRKGESSGNTLAVAEVWVDCDGDALIYAVDPRGPSCHTGARNCFFRPLRADGPGEAVEGGALPTLVRLGTQLEQRRDASGAKSYTRSLLDGGPPKIAGKIEEEAEELGRAIGEESDERVASEAADLLYHAMVGLLSRGLSLREVAEVLAGRLGVSGHVEKASRQEP